MQSTPRTHSGAARRGSAPVVDRASTADRPPDSPIVQPVLPTTSRMLPGSQARAAIRAGPRPRPLPRAADPRFVGRGRPWPVPLDASGPSGRRQRTRPAALFTSEMPRSCRSDTTRAAPLRSRSRLARATSARACLRVDTPTLRLLRCPQRVSTLTHRVLTTMGDRPWRDDPAAHSAPWTFARRRSFGPSSRNTSRPRRRSAARRSSSAIASACPARPSAASSPSSRRTAC